MPHKLSIDVEQLGEAHSVSIVFEPVVETVEDEYDAYGNPIL